MVARSPQIVTQAIDTQTLDVPVVDRSLRWLDCGQLKVEAPNGRRSTLIGRRPTRQEATGGQVRHMETDQAFSASGKIA